MARASPATQLAKSLCEMDSQKRSSHIEDLVLQVATDLAGNGEVTATTPLMEAGIDSLAATEMVSQLRVLSGALLPPTVMTDYPTTRSLATHLIDRLPGDTVIMQDTAAVMATVDFARTSVALGHAAVPPKRLSCPIILVLGTIRCGSSLLQLCLNAHSQLYAGQELYLLMFDTMGERRAALASTDYADGLLATLMELRGCTLAETEALVSAVGDDFPTWQMYSYLQELCAPRVLVDKTPANANHLMILRRAREVFATPSYLHLVRHPYASIESALQLMRDILGSLHLTWSHLEQSWVDANMVVHEHLLTVESSSKLMLRCDLCPPSIAPLVLFHPHSTHP